LSWALERAQCCKAPRDLTFCRYKLAQLLSGINSAAFTDILQRTILDRRRDEEVACGSGDLHPQTQGKIERWHQTLKNRILLENYFLLGDLEQQIEAFVGHYNHRRYRESLSGLINLHPI